MKPVAFLAGAVLLIAGSAQARPPQTSEAILVSASGTVTETIIDGRVWRCLGAGCRGRAAGEPASQSAARECRRVAARLGELAFYRAGGRAFGPAELAACNTAAAKRRSDPPLAGSR